MLTHYAVKENLRLHQFGRTLEDFLDTIYFQDLLRNEGLEHGFPKPEKCPVLHYSDEGYHKPVVADIVDKMNKEIEDEKNTSNI